MNATDGQIDLDLVPMALLRLGVTERITFANGAAKRLLGDDLDGRLISDVIRHPELHSMLDHALGEGRAGRGRLVIAAPAGTGHFDVHVTPEGGPRGGVLLAFEDQTTIENAAAIRRDFVANVSHELRTPLTALVGFIETLRGAAREDPGARERFLGVMERETGRMIRLVNDLLSLSRVEADEHRRPAETVDIIGVLKSVITTQRDHAGAAGVDMSLEAPEPPLMVRGDPDQLLQVFLNLAENAIKYGASGGRLDFTVTRIRREPKIRGPAVAVEVADYGEGIDPLHLPRLTERFYRIDNHRSREKGGTGLGLAIVKHIVNRHRGRLRIESEPGKGSKFTVILPAAGTAG